MASIVIEELLRDGASRRDSTFLASTSTVYPSYTASKDDANHKITLNFQNNSSPTIRLAKDQASGEYIANSLMIKIYWAGTSSNSRTPQEVILVNGDAYGCEWYCNGVKLTPDNASVVVADGSTIYAKPLVNAADVPTETTTKIRIRGYWQTNTTPYSNTGCYNKPSIIQRYVNYTIDWVPPDLSSYSEINKPKIIGYLIVFWKGDWGSLEGVTGIGGIDMTDGDSTSFVSPSKWFSGANGHHLKHTVFTIFNTGISPKISDVISECISERPTNHKGTGDGNSVKDYSHYSKIDPNDTTQLYEVSFYMPDGETYVRVNQQDFTSFQVDGSNVVTPTGTSWITKDYMLAGWYRKDNNGAWGTELLTNSAVQDIIVHNKLSFKAKFVKKERNLIFDGNGGKVYTAFDSDTQVDQEHVLRKVNFEDNYGQMCNASRIGFILDGWYTSATGGTKVSAGTTMAEGTGDVIIYAHWKESWDVTMDDLIFLHYERPSVKMAVKRDSLENPEGVRLWVKPTIHPLLDKSGKDKNFVTDITDIYYRRENRSNSNFTSGGTATYDSRIYYNWQTANSESDIIKNSNGSIPAFDTGVLMNKVKTNNTAKQRDFDMDTEYQFRCLVRDALQSYYDKNSEAYGSDYPYKSDEEDEEKYSPWGQYLNIPSNWTNADSVARLNCKSSGISDASNDGKAATLLKYVTKLLVHNPFMDEVLKESRSLTIVNHKPVWGKQLRDEQNPPETDFWQIREHTQNSINEVDSEESIAEFVNSILEMRSREPNEDTLTGGSVNGFNRQEIEDFLIPTLKRALRNDENLVYDYSQINPLLDILYAINSEHTKIAQEYSEENEAEEYSGLTVGDTSTASNIDSQKISKRILELDGERHQTDTNWETESDSLDNRVKDTEYKDVELRNFEQNQVDGDAQSTIDHIYDYDISQLDLKNSLSDLIYILSRMNPRQMGTEGAKANFNDPSKDTTNMSTYWDSANNRYKDSAFTNWIPSQGKWRTAENDLAEYNSAVDGNNLLVGTEALDPNNTYGENDFLNNGCRATCMGLCTSGCYQSCVGGCKTACGDSCFFGCKTSCSGNCGTTCGSECGDGCSSGCGTSCTVNCGTGCAFTCGNGCGTTCSKGCGESCRIQCSATCTGNCKNNCQGSCANGCTLGCKETCNTSCGSGCQSNCSGRCDKSCGGGCTDNCSGGCSKTCKDGCQGGCKKSCQGTCGNGCTTGCTADCGGSSCKNGCTSNCSTECTKNCHTSCGSGCSHNCDKYCTIYCQNTCSGACKKDCTSGCVESCLSLCYENCETICTDGCDERCMTVCSNNCEGVCRGICKGGCGGTCSTACASGCYKTCSVGCKQGCSNGCGGCSGCGNICTHACNSTCQRYCETNCEYACSGSCNNTCGYGCAQDCGGKCGGGCSTFCNNYCEKSCAVNCSSTCIIGCKTNCGWTCFGDCATYCGGKCQGTCETDCKNVCRVYCTAACTESCVSNCNNACFDECKGNCSSACSTSCYSSCNNDCGGLCYAGCDSGCGQSCGTTCTKNCQTSCNVGCTGTCNNTCSGYCSGGCKTDCGASCGTGCKNKCDKGCDTSCGVTCQSDCNNKCKNGCNDSCLSRCIGSCTADCSNECGHDCISSCDMNCNQTCAENCQDGCSDSCGVSCGSSCKSDCYNSCHTSCTGSAYKLSA